MGCDYLSGSQAKLPDTYIGGISAGIVREEGYPVGGRLHVLEVF